jgi:hypothetical protein
MPISIVCESCQSRMKVRTALGGRKVKCPKCAAAVSVPSAQMPAELEAVQASRAGASQSAGAVVARPPAVERVASQKPKAAPPKAKADNDSYDDLEIVQSPPGSSPWATSSLGQRENLLVIGASIFQLSSFVYRDFAILDPQTKKRVGIANDNPGLLTQCLSFLLPLRRFLPTNLEVREDEKGPLLFRLSRVPQLLQFMVTVDVYDEKSRLLFRFKNKIFSLFGGFRVYDPDNNQIAELKMEFTPLPRIVFVMSTGESVGTIYPEGSRPAFEQGKITTSISVGRKLGSDLKISKQLKDDPRARLMLLAAVLATKFASLRGGFQGNKGR